MDKNVAFPFGIQTHLKILEIDKKSCVPVAFQ